MTTLNGQYFDGLRPVAVDATMDLSGQEAALTAGDLYRQYAISDINISPRIGLSDRFISLPDKGQFCCRDDVLLNSLPQESFSEGLVAWLEGQWLIALAAVAIIVCLLLTGYFFGLPAVADDIAARIPIETEQSLGNQAITWLDENGWFGPTQMDGYSRKIITQGFNHLIEGLPFMDYYRLEFRSGNVFGANALAFPGGIIVITDEMIKETMTDEEIFAILAHEIGHVELRHTLRGLVEGSVIAAIAATITADAASLSLAVAGFPALLAQTKYSREFESEADEYAFSLLKSKGYSPMSFALIMERLMTKYGDMPGALNFLSTHPVTKERIRRAAEAAKE